MKTNVYLLMSATGLASCVISLAYALRTSHCKKSLSFLFTFLLSIECRGEDTFHRSREPMSRKTSFVGATSRNKENGNERRNSSQEAFGLSAQTSVCTSREKEVYFA